MSEVSTVSLPEFLAARVEEDEREAVTDRERAEVHIKRELMAIHRRHPRPSYGLDECEGCGTEGDCDWAMTEHIDDCPVLRIMGLRYVDHPDYQAGWAPEAPLVSMQKGWK